MNPRFTLLAALIAVAALIISPLAAAEPPSPNTTPQNAQPQPAAKPNIVIIFTDDLGYGDLSTFGHPTIHTPNLDTMAAQGQKWTNFYSAASICTPSRAGLLTGRLPIRSGLAGGVFFPWSAGGLPDYEITIAEQLKQVGYATAAIGKWHLGHLPQHLPTTQGFDTYFGIPYSNDMARREADGPRWKQFNVPLIRDGEIIEQPANQTTITKRYTQEAVKFIREHKDEPFFVYLAHNLPHIPLFVSEEFKGTSRRGLYGDVIEEIDWSVGQILDTLREQGLAENTLVVFTSDNGPWLIKDQAGGSAGLLRNGKNTTWEGGMREPTIFWWPDHLKQSPVIDLGSTLDLLPTISALAGVKLPTDRILDGYDLSPALLGTGPSPRNVMFYHHGNELRAIRKGPYKAHFITTDKGYGPHRNKQHHNPPLLYHLGHDPSEKYNIAQNHPDIITELSNLAQQHKQTIQPVENQLRKRIKDQP